jgi:putative ABC transport system permease protein
MRPKETPRRWTAVLLRLLPRAFRSRFGHDVEDVALALSADARKQGGYVRQARYISREILEGLRLSVSLRVRRPGARDLRPARILMRETLHQEIRWGLRHACRHPALAAMVVCTVALSVATATSGFSIASAVLWRPLPFDHPAELTFIWEEFEREGHRSPGRVTRARYSAWRQASDGLASLALFGATGFTLDTIDGATTVRGLRVSSNYFETLGIRPVLGRTFSQTDEVPGSQYGVVLSSGFWRTQLGGRPDAIGTQIRLSGQAYTVLGVMPDAPFPGWPVNPADVTLDDQSFQVWVPLVRNPALEHDARAHVFGVLARLRVGVSAADLLARLDRTSGPSAAEPHGARLSPFREQFVASTRLPLMVLIAAAIAVLLIASANLAALQASLFEARRPELATRRALGASAAGLARQLGSETFVVVSAGTLIGLGLTHVALSMVPRLMPASVPLLAAPAIDLLSLAFAGFLGALTTTLVSGWPILRVLRRPPASRGVVPAGRGPVFRTLVAGQVAIAVALTFAAGLLGRSLTAIERQPLGFRAEGVLVADIGLRSAQGAGQSAAELSVVSALSALPGVTGVAMAYDHPLEANWSENPTVVSEADDVSAAPQVDLRIVSPGYFETLGVEVLEGRPLSDRDRFDAPGAVVVNEAFARQIGGRILGRRLRTGTPAVMAPGAPREFEIVGIVVNERFRGLEHPAQPAYYLSTRQFPQASLSLLVRTQSDPMARAADVRSIVKSLDPRITLDQVTTLDAILDRQLKSRRLTTDLISGFATTALTLSALGIYGLMTMLVASRRREIGIRLAIGAAPGSVAREVIQGAVQHAAAGILVGVACAIAAGRLIQGLLVGVSHHDPFMLAAVVTVLLTTAVAAALVPALRAARVDPVDALRSQ